jgi:uncharacterized membrane protein|tara:strand:+ start:503 stop:703 length:201 start_codon:yes stop_codon:yes gene_type:complete
MGVLEIVILSLVGLFLFSTGWLVRISQILIGVLMNFGRSVLTNFVEDTIKEDPTKQPANKKKSKRT